MALSSLEVDLSGVEEGQTMTVKWRGKPVFIRHRTDAEINQSAEVALSELRDPQKDVDRAINPKVGWGGGAGGGVLLLRAALMPALQAPHEKLRSIHSSLARPPTQGKGPLR